MVADDDDDDGGGSSSPEEAEALFVAGLLARGEAAPADDRGQLPAGATHELIEDEAGNTTVKRRRFSAF